MIQPSIIAAFLFVILLFSTIIILLIRKNKWYQNELTEREKGYNLFKNDYDLMHAEICKARDDRLPLVDEINQLKEVIIEQSARIRQDANVAKNSLKSARDFRKIFFTKNEPIDRIIQNAFFYNRPCKTLSGDFYCIENVDDKLYILLGDCTGYDVEASFMTLLASALVKECIHTNQKKREHNAASSLISIRNDFLRKIHNHEKQTDNISHLRKIELIFCILDKETKTIQFAGAGNSIVHIGGNELNEYKGNKTPIGICMKPENEFTNHEISFKENDCLYLFTDGYSYFTENSRKFSKKQFKELLKEISLLTIEEQQKVIEQKYNNINLIDDFLLLGIKFS